MKVTVWIEVEPDRATYDVRVGRTRIVNVKAGRMWKTRPTSTQLRPGAIAVQVTIDVPQERMEHVVEAVVPPAPPVQLAAAR